MEAVCSRAISPACLGSTLSSRLPISSVEFSPHRTRLRRGVGIAVIAGGVVVGQFAIEPRAFGQGHQILKQILVLPVELPLADPEQDADFAVGQGGGELGFLAEVVRVRRRRRRRRHRQADRTIRAPCNLPRRREYRCWRGRRRRRAPGAASSGAPARVRNTGRSRSSRSAAAPLGWKCVCIRKSEPLGRGIATPCGRKAGVVPGTHPPSPPLSALSGSPTVKMEPKPGNPGWPSTPSCLRAPPVVSEKNSE